MKDFFKRLISDDNSINEKIIIGIASFLIMIIYAIIALSSQFWGVSITVDPIIYSSFVTITLGSLGISSIQRIGESHRNETETEN